jgi:hypothetical protein
MRKYDQSLVEVWEWKEKVYHDVKELTPDQYINKIKENSDKILSDALIMLTPVFQKKGHQKLLKNVAHNFR